MAKREIEGVIARIGGRGDGVLAGADGNYYVPFTVPGDRITARIGEARGDGYSASLRELLSPGPDRVEAPCPHFHACGGCALQMLADGAYAEWKRGLVASALSRQGLGGVAVEPLARVPQASRRRADLVLRRLQSSTLLGFHERGEKRIVDITSCLVLRPEIVALLAPLRESLGPLFKIGGGGDILVTRTDAGLDVGLAADLAADGEARVALARFAERHDLARLSLVDRKSGYVDVIVQRRGPVLNFAGVAVEVPPGGFIQASVEAERLLVERALAALGAARAVADLYSGIGTFAFALAAAGHKVLAVEGDDAAFNALDRAAKRAGGLRVQALHRDLARAPLTAAELNRHEAAIFDPPRVGAQAQALEMAKSKLEVVVGVSCHPGSFARDARLLADGGFKLESVLPIDQFLWSPQVELIGVFRR